MRVLIIGALDGQIGIASQIAIARGAKVMQADNIEEALDTLRGGHGAELVMIDVGLDIAHLMNNLTAERITIPVVACGMTTDADAAVRAIESGAKEFIPLPPQADLIAAVFEAVAEERHALIFRDPKMAELVRLADRVALVDASVLITGESGTGKEVLARYIYGKSKRADRPFITVNCAAIPENLLESELFGHEKGAFTGAVARRVGKFEAANSGTFLLDEISEMDTRLQAKLMRAIQEREIDRVGGNHPIPVDIRLIATSNRDLDAAVAKGDFREDLLYRINVVNLTVPPLRTRPSDIEALAEHFVQKYTELNDVEEKQLTPETLTRLKAHAWRGNVRELENTIHRAVVFSNGPTIDPGTVMLPVASPGDLVSPASEAASDAVLDPASFISRTVAEVERDLILETLDHCLGNRTHAANILGISIRTLRNKIKQYTDEGVQVAMPREAGRATV